MLRRYGGRARRGVLCCAAPLDATPRVAMPPRERSIHRRGSNSDRRYLRRRRLPRLLDLDHHHRYHQHPTSRASTPVWTRLFFGSGRMAAVAWVSSPSWVTKTLTPWPPKPPLLSPPRHPHAHLLAHPRTTRQRTNPPALIRPASPARPPSPTLLQPSGTRRRSRQTFPSLPRWGWAAWRAALARSWVTRASWRW